LIQLRITWFSTAAFASLTFETATWRQSTSWNFFTDIGGIVIIFGLIFLLIGFIAGVPILWTIGMIVLIVGLVLWAMGTMGHSVRGRRHYY
jgi:hypothetical protein